MALCSVLSDGLRRIAPVAHVAEISTEAITDGVSTHPEVTNGNPHLCPRQLEAWEYYS